MQTHPIPPFEQITLRDGICVADGYGIKIHIERRHLVVADGVGTSRRVRRYHKTGRDLKRLVVVGATGYISLEAVRWLADAGIPFIHLDGNGRLFATSAVLGANRPSLRRAQAWAATNQTGIEITKWILRLKLNGQLQIAVRLGADTSLIDRLVNRLDELGNLNDLLITEAQVGAEYWKAWRNVEVTFATRDRNRVPEHWKRFVSRTGGVTGTARMAANPANAILNYMYALLEAETTIGCHVVGLDPGIGILHADQHSRDSLALDLMEASRPNVDRWLLDLLEGHHFRARDFTEDRRGSCRINPPLTHRLGEMTATLADEVGPIIETVAKLLAETPGVKPTRIATPLTGGNRSTGRRKAASSQSKSGRRLSATCPTCGGVRSRDREMCQTCFLEWRKLNLEEITRASQTRLSDLRQAGLDPAHGGQAGRRRAEAVANGKRESLRWDEQNKKPSNSEFETIRSSLMAVTVGAMSRTTGLSPGYCSMIRRGIKTPHPRHWEALTELVRTATPEQTLNRTQQ
jgi:CRISPR-associated endonuclease Cas1